VESTENQDTIAEPERASRRNLLRLFGLGGVASAVAFAARPAYAQDTTTTAPTSPGDPGGTTTSVAATSSTTAGTTTTPPPKAPTDGDRTILAALKTIELSATQGYSVLTPDRLSALGYDEPTTQVLGVLDDHHRAYAESLSGLFGPGLQVTSSEQVLQALQADQLANGDAAAVLATAQAIEESILDTYLNALDSIESTQLAGLAASILVVQARQAAVLGRLQGQPYNASAPAQEDGAQALTLAGVVGA